MKTSNILWGIVLIAIGVILGLNALDITNINIFFEGWWTLIIIVPCFIDLFKNESKTGNIIGILIGIFLLLACRDIVSFSIIWKLVLPVILVLIGLSFIFKDVFNKEIKKEIKRLNKSDNKEYCSTFSSQDIDLSNEEFTGCTLTSVFGGIECDLRKAKIKEDVVINATSIFGGITLYVPEDVNIKINSTAIFGGINDERKDKTKDGKRTIYLNGTSLFGGIDIK